MAGQPNMHVDLAFEAFELSADLPLTPVLDWWADLKMTNSRAREAEGRLPLKVRVVCPSCASGPTHLTSVSEDGAVRRACRICHCRFDVEC
jgi:hypothetical protein